MSDTADFFDWLSGAGAVRERCDQLLNTALADELPHFTVHLDKLDECVHRVVETTRASYPDLAIPYHSRWRHFVFDDNDLATPVLSSLAGEELARTGFDLAITSVLLDAGAGARWRYRSVSRTGLVANRSEGLALASLEMFCCGAFSSDAAQPLRADADGLERLTPGRLQAGFQSGDDNPLLGVAGRCEILQRLGGAVREQFSEFTSDVPRVGHLFDALVTRCRDNKLPATLILREVLRRFVSIWPNAQTYRDMVVGDVGRHSSIADHDALVPLHKLSQWLAYSLVEPLQWAGIEVTDLDRLTGLAEYRNGGLLIDTGVLRPRRAELLQQPLQIYSEPVVEWRALTVALLDRIADGVRERLAMNAEQLPLAKVLQGGTWTAGRRIAAERRPDGAPPVRLASDGTVF